MGNFSNLAIFVEPETTLFQQETNVILEVIDQVLNSFENYPTKGTFILDGQKMGERAICIMRFNLKDGYAQPLQDTSDTIAANAINNILSWPESPAYGYQGESKFFGQLPSNIYKYGYRRVLVLNTTYGRFLVSFFANTGCGFYSSDAQDKGSTVLLAVAKAIALMGKEDKILQRSIQYLQDKNPCPEQDIMGLVQKMFDDCTLPALAAWKAWHEPANSAGDLTLFFE